MLTGPLPTRGGELKRVLDAFNFYVVPHPDMTCFATFFEGGGERGLDGGGEGVRIYPLKFFDSNRQV